MGDLNASLVLPKGWEQLKWSDWELQAKSKDGMLFHLFKSDYQPDLTEANVAAHAEAYLVPLADQGFSEPTTTNASLTEIAGRPAGFVRTAVSIPKVGRGTAVTAIFAGKGITLHARVIAVAGQASKAEATLTAMLGLPPDALPIVLACDVVIFTLLGWAFSQRALPPKPSPCGVLDADGVRWRSDSIGAFLSVRPRLLGCARTRRRRRRRPS
jgi:hypothetical protein